MEISYGKTAWGGERKKEGKAARKEEIPLAHRSRVEAVEHAAPDVSHVSGAIASEAFLVSLSFVSLSFASTSSS